MFLRIAASHSCSAGVVSLSWAVQRGITVIPKSSVDARVEENIRLVELTNSEMEEMNDAHKTVGKVRLVEWITDMHQTATDGTDTIMGWTREDFGWEDSEGNWLT